MAEGARLESEYTPKAYRGFESPSLRHIKNQRKGRRGYEATLDVCVIFT